MHFVLLCSKQNLFTVFVKADAESEPFTCDGSLTVNMEEVWDLRLKVDITFRPIFYPIFYRTLDLWEIH